MMPDGEFYYADSAYRSSYTPSLTKHDIPDNDIEGMKKIMSRHETINRRFKDWSILNNTFRHKEHLHEYVFGAIAVLTQLEIQEGMHIYEV